MPEASIAEYSRSLCRGEPKRRIVLTAWWKILHEIGQEGCMTGLLSAPSGLRVLLVGSGDGNVSEI
jgi:hypothetical protein